MKTHLLILTFILFAQSNTGAQNLAANTKKPITTNKVASVDTPQTKTLVVLKDEFVKQAKLKITENEKSIAALKAVPQIKDKQELAYYKEKVQLFESRNNDLNNRMYEFNVVSGTVYQFNEFKKRWYWALDELEVYEKNLKGENQSLVTK